MSNTDQIADWLLSELELKSALFHVGQYCGIWRASTSGLGRASFHVILHGYCWLHVPARHGHSAESIRLAKGDSVFLLKDMPHCLSPNELAPDSLEAVIRLGTMVPLTPDEVPGHLKDGKNPAAASVGLACGFFDFESDISDSILAALPDYIVAKHDVPELAGARTVFELIRVEALRSGDTPTAMMARLTDLLFFYALRAMALKDELTPGLWSLMRQAEFASLVSAIIDRPEENWTTASMANFAHMSRARFCKRFVEVSNLPPAQFVTTVRMKVAAAMLREGNNSSQVAHRVGYHSESAFSQAFKRETGVLPGAYRREKSQAVASAPPLATDLVH
ncbi:AraC family transcriptional regulator [Paraburkholderia sp. BCC1884]|uniref:AraC family transcriptional regulator n=1 Tax=Paraburkholderia sp. BCC1884 TaxID=2562668 RepID=UPI001182FD32|nr:AraC family transcriptional regulator [Paraburkholderia sp. BCC1884]